MRIGILGSGLMGAKLGTLFAQAGHEVLFSYSRSESKLKELARKAGTNACSGSVKEAVERSDVLLLAVNWGQMVAAQLIRDVGFDPEDLGDLRMARNLEPFSMIIAHLAYSTGKGSRVAYRFEWMGE